MERNVKGMFVRLNEAKEKICTSFSSLSEMVEMNPKLKTQNSKLTLFVDAYRAEAGAANLQMRMVDALPLRSLVWHTGEPYLLLALANVIYNRSPCAWWITAPAISFDYGAELTGVAQSGKVAALVLSESRNHAARPNRLDDVS